MKRLFLGLLMILFIGGQTKAEGFEITFELIQKIYGWGLKIYTTLDKYKNPEKFRDNIVEIMKQLNEVSSQLDALETHLDIKLDSMLNTLLSQIKIEGNFIPLKAKLRRSLIKIDDYFDRTKDYKFGGPFGNQTLKDFAHKTLWSHGSVPDLLQDIYAVFVPTGSPTQGFLSHMLQITNLNLLHECDTHASPQQRLYYLYIELIVTEMKGLLAQQHCFMLKQLFDDSSYNFEAKLHAAKRDAEVRLKAYHELFSSMINQISQHIRRCEVHSPQRGLHFLEMHNFSRIAFLDSYIVENERCYACPAESTLHDESIRTHTTISDCRMMGTVVTTCPAERGSSREFLWWEDQSGNHYGPNVPCPQTSRREGGSVTIQGYRSSPTIYRQCKVCVCSMEMNRIDKDDDKTIFRISTTEQTSDYRNNKVVTGVKFVIHDNGLHLQIKQAKFSQSGFNCEHNEWKALDIGYHNGNESHVSGPMQYVSLRHNRKSVHLDDISTPEGYVVTGVRLKLVDDSAFELQILATEFDIGSGNLHQSSSMWIDSSRYPTRPDDYKRKRIEIDNSGSDDPTRASEFKYDFQSNKLIKFTHTDINKDGGQTTIPLLEAQAVETNPAFPLSGLGLTFKERERFSGYITPRIYTLDVTKYMRHPKIDEVTTPAYEKTEYVIKLLDGEVYSDPNNEVYTTD